MLSADEIRLLLNLLAQKTVVDSSREFPFRITREERGYSDNPTIGQLQAKLSIMLEAATRSGS